MQTHTGSTPISNTSKPRTEPRTLKLSGLLNVDKKAASSATSEQKNSGDEPYTEAQLKSTWNEFAEQRKKFQAEYQLLTQAYEIQDNQIIVHLHNPVQEGILNNIRSELGAFLREQLRNNSIQVRGELKEGEEKKIRYTNREKFEYLIEKNPLLGELKDRLGLDTDF